MTKRCPECGKDVTAPPLGFGVVPVEGKIVYSPNTDPGFKIVAPPGQEYEIAKACMSTDEDYYNKDFGKIARQNPYNEDWDEYANYLYKKLIECGVKDFKIYEAGAPGFLGLIPLPKKFRNVETIRELNLDGLTEEDWKPGWEKKIGDSYWTSPDAARLGGVTRDWVNPIKDPKTIEEVNRYRRSWGIKKLSIPKKRVR